MYETTEGPLVRVVDLRSWIAEQDRRARRSRLLRISWRVALATILGYWVGAQLSRTGVL